MQIFTDICSAIVIFEAAQKAFIWLMHQLTGLDAQRQKKFLFALS